MWRTGGLLISPSWRTYLNSAAEKVLYDVDAAFDYTGFHYGAGGSSSQYFRPACYIATDYIDALTGSGTAEDPYHMEISPGILERAESQW